MVVQFNLRAFFSVRTWPWMMLFYKLRPLLRSAQVEKELATLTEDFTKLKEAYDKCVPPPATTGLPVGALLTLVSPSGRR